MTRQRRMLGIGMALLIALAVGTSASARDEVGARGGRLSVAQRAEARTLNPMLALDQPSKEILNLLMADLVHINRETQQTEPALAESWKVSADGRRYTLRLREGLRFSDGHALTSDDVVFTFRVYLDEKVGAPQRDLLLVDGRALTVSNPDARTVVVELPRAVAAGDRIFDSVFILPRHILEKPYLDGTLAQAWSVASTPSQIVGAGPFKMAQYAAGARIVVDRNPYYWKVDSAGQRLPYLDQVVFSVVASEDAQVLRFQAGEADVVSRIAADNFAALDARRDLGRRMIDAGPGLEYNFLFFNLNDLPADATADARRHHAWFATDAFRQAVSAAIDRDAIVRLVYRGRATALASFVTPGNRRWVNQTVTVQPRSVARGRDLLRSAGFSWDASGRLLDREHQPVRFSIVVAASNAARSQMATLIQADLTELGAQVDLVPLEFRTMVSRVLEKKDFDAAVFGIASGDADPTSEMNVWLSSGPTHVWHPEQKTPATAWEAEIDRWMNRQATTTDYSARKALYDRVQAIVAERLPIIPLASPNVLTGTAAELANFRPAVLEPVALWNADRLFWRRTSRETR